MTYRMEKPCVDCPFSDSKAGRHLRDSLEDGRIEEIKIALLADGHFMCHQTTEEDEDGEHSPSSTDLSCAGSIAWQEEQGVGASQYLRVCERLAAARG